MPAAVGPRMIAFVSRIDQVGNLGMNGLRYLPQHFDGKNPGVYRCDENGEHE
jgi:hypothetical protein